MKQKLLIIVIVVIIGVIIGYGIGVLLLEKTVTGQSAFSFFITRPLNIYVILNSKLYSNNPLDRLTAYYTLYDMHIVDTPFLQERYKQEENIALKRAILKTLSLHHDSELIQFIGDIYELSDKALKIDMVKIIKNNYPGKFAEFAQKHRVDAQWIHEE
ncbi:MAG: hypothetical protein KBG92_00615 [Spirochaetes bacterium]|jgi:hypothetical protein|nr:hypothetical protein [Spirochaetota bacterium]